MRFTKNLRIAVLMTVVTTALLGIGYPLVVTGLAQLLFPERANGQLIDHDGRLVGSRIIGQPFHSPGYFRPRPSAAGAAGYDPTASGGSNLGPTNSALVEGVRSRIEHARAENPDAPVPIDMVTSSGSGLDPDISPAAAAFQVPRVARERGIPEDDLMALVGTFTAGRDLGVLGEPRVNVLLLNLALDQWHPMPRRPYSGSIVNR
jgi:K+-transporting ATPase ATPase C chain